MWQRSCKALCLLVWLITLPAHATCGVTEQALVGAWQSANADGYFEVFELHANHRFDSWLHDRPEIMGANWRYKHCVLTIVAGPSNIFSYQVKLNQSQLILNDIQQRDGKFGLYQKIK